MARHKAKRYDGEEGSLVTAKRANINDPDSYNVPMPLSEEEAATNSYNREMGSKYSSQASDMEPEGTSNVRETTTISRPSPKKVIVTKEQLAASGYDNLRDYLNAQRRGSTSGSSTYQDMLRNAPEGTSETALKALKRNAENEASKYKDLEKGVSRGRKSTSPEAPKTTQGATRKPYNPDSLSTSYPGSKFSKGGRVAASKRADGCCVKGHTKGRMI
jgi:hypothetical protein